MIDIVAEVGPANGSLSYARECIDALAGVDFNPKRFRLFMKAQFYTADTLTTHTPRYDFTEDEPEIFDQHELFQTQLSYEEWAEVKAYAEEMGIGFFPTVFSEEAVRAAVKMGCKRMKIASGDITHTPLIKYAAEWADELVISTGASTVPEVIAAILAAKKAGPPIRVCVLACHLEYPTETRNANLSRIREVDRTDAVGYSDHTPGTYTAAILPALGITMWEKHFTVAPGTGGDHNFAITPDELQEAIDDMDMTLETLGSGYMEPTEGEQAALEGARRSAVATRDIAKGDPIVRDMVAYLRPGTGIPPYEMEGILSARQSERAMVDIPAGTVIERRWIGHVGATLTVG